MNYKWKYYSHDKLCPKEEGHITVPIPYEFPVVRCSQYNNDYCKKIIAILKVLILSALLTLLGCTSIILYINYHFKSALLEDNKTLHAYCAEFNKAAVKSNAYLDSSQTGDILNVQPYYDHYDKNNFQRTSGYGIKTRIVRKAENNKEEEFKKWLQSLDVKDLFSSVNANPHFKADLKKFVDKPNDAGDDVQKLFAQVITKYRNIVETYVKDLVINTFDAVDAQMFNSSTNSKNNKQDLDKNSNKN
ncbi:hypothetical protein TSAR_001597 [Trichomalopsis sarcophagae]|uniref:Uncharacterized protein n=1 Tax=Trichomalopsis sarcophagae TaxID=543379 RepID=A0A232F192_9HYME|nr:hypothetical protein TSAR_001597 [Trichomalopsis sarcophagae]